MMQTFDDNYLAGRVILVTGATQGVGRDTALTAARHGATVVLLARSVRGLEKVYDEIVAQGSPEPVAIPLDLLEASDDAFNTLAYQIKHAVGRLDGIVHCAQHFFALSPLTDQRIDEWMNQYRINTVAPFALTRACLPLLKAADDASVVFVGETHGQQPGPFWGAFGASKAGLNYLMQVAASEWDVYPNLRVNLLVPGPINSPFRTRTHPGEDKSERGNIAELMPHMLYWLGAASKGRSGEIVSLDLRSNKA
ncbi:SDR family oxidoreductase [Vogesella amnigena]|uniref:SDR family oxidoreductase n=1 Tax=Vogesella amnigena TaxID=1507449 RepID=A0ABV7TT80_9NEIS